MITTLEKYCELRNWQGGTIHQAHDDFLQLNDKERQKIVGSLVDCMTDISDYKNIGWFTQANIDHIEFVTIKLKEAAL